MSGELFMNFGGMDMASSAESRLAQQRQQASSDHLAATGNLGGASWTDAAYRQDFDGVRMADNRAQENGMSQLDFARRIDTCSGIGRDTVNFAVAQCSQLLV
jgi:hypothetical protein